MVVYGRNPVREAIRGPRMVTAIWATKHALREPSLEAAGIAVRTASAEEIERRCGSIDHQGICAEVSHFVYAHADELLGAAEPDRRAIDPLIVVLDQVQDPQNLGAICRTAECVGASGVVIPERRAAEVTPAVSSPWELLSVPVRRRNRRKDLRSAPPGVAAASVWARGD